MASEKKRNITWKEMKKQKVLIIWSLIIVVYGVIFCYLPLAGWMMAFQNYKPKDYFIPLLSAWQNSNSCFLMTPLSV